MGGHGHSGSGHRHQRQRQDGTPTERHAAGTVCPPRFDSVAGGVHTFGKDSERPFVCQPVEQKFALGRDEVLGSVHVPHYALEKNNKLTEQLTDRQTRILEYIRYVTKTRNYPPSVREIGEAVGLSSSSTVHNHLNQLERRGLIKRDPSKSRTVQLVADAELDQQRRNAVVVPIIGNVAAGTPILAEQNIEDHVLLSPELAEDDYFLLRVRGDSMINAGILDGDMVLVRPQHEATNGSIVVALVEGDATVKRFERANGHVKLIAENPAYEPIVTTNVSLVGIVRGVIRLFR
jgi:repressor LexA